MDLSDRLLTHPGPALEPRVEIVAGTGHVFRATLPAGRTLHDAIQSVLSARRLESAIVRFGETVFEPIVYLLPAVAPGPELRFTYSEPQRPAGPGRVSVANVTCGRREGAPFCHCHAMWQEPDGRLHGGHVVPTETVLKVPVEATFWTLPAAATLSEFDAETGYTLFHPVAVPAPEAAPAESGPRLAMLRVKPNADLPGALEQATRETGFAAARVRGGVGSLIGARFADGTALEDKASEVLITEGRIAPGPDGALRAEVEIGFSGFSGLATQGRLLGGENPVCITFELMLEECPLDGAS